MDLFCLGKLYGLSFKITIFLNIKRWHRINTCSNLTVKYTRIVVCYILYAIFSYCNPWKYNFFYVTSTVCYRISGQNCNELGYGWYLERAMHCNARWTFTSFTFFKFWTKSSLFYQNTHCKVIIIFALSQIDL